MFENLLNSGAFYIRKFVKMYHLLCSKICKYRIDILENWRKIRIYHFGERTGQYENQEKGISGIA